MNQEAKKQPETSLAGIPPHDRAYLALSLDHNEQALVDLAGKYTDVTEIKDKADYRMVMRGGIELMKARTAIRATGKAARDDANAYRKAVIAEENRLVAITEPEEIRLRGLRQEYDEAEERKATEARLLEQRRIADITERIQAIKALTEGLINADSDGIAMRLDAVMTIECTQQLFAEFAEQAAEVRFRAETMLKAALDQRKAFEFQLAEAERIARDQATRQAELDRQAEEQAERERVAQEKIAQQADDIRRQQEAIEADKRAEQEKRLAAERAESARVTAEKDRLEREAREREEAERAEQTAAEYRARQEAIRPDKEKLLAWCEYLRRIEPPVIVDIQLQAYRNSASEQVRAIGDNLQRWIEGAA